ncbi:hypothetical protein [Streptomyces diastatochromogenes]|uniref:Uncharacterized protein n=1 Tax=Streptomyces diastatochromogenes TaxID=42236 RepID=A0A233SGQ3_STRDA|nr:hypothetical protein [Streptomyces diastatochromogenes]MCZ0985710.1 hypothetical protein [Streptomyces diastatochromogenes]OXY94831.1 hypothetical protein BEK98_17025 [Streptomyces diastatochromogenes]
MRLAREADELGPPRPSGRVRTPLLSHVRELHAEHRNSLDLDDAAGRRVPARFGERIDTPVR